MSLFVFTITQKLIDRFKKNRALNSPSGKDKRVKVRNRYSQEIKNKHKNKKTKKTHLKCLSSPKLRDKKSMFI